MVNRTGGPVPKCNDWPLEQLAVSMHQYTTDSSERKFIPFVIAVAGILAAWGLNRVFQVVHIIPPWWFDAPAAFGFYELFYNIFNRWGWRWSIFRKIGLVRIPDLKGEWKGHLTSSFDKHGTEYEATIEIYQNWREISITLETPHSKSRSIIAAITINNPSEVILGYEYLNEPKANAIDGMHAHRGTVHLTLAKTKNRVFLNGDYYSGRDRQNYGDLKEFKRNES